MPTIRPLPSTDDGGGEGQLKPITVKPAAAPQNQVAQSPAPQNGVAQSPAPTVRTWRATSQTPTPPQPSPTPPPPAKGRTILTGMKGGPSLRGNKAAEAQSETPTRTAPQSNNPYDESVIRRLWDAFILQHPTEVILVNTMRASRPARTDAASHQWTVTVENAAQQAKIEEHMPALLKALRDGAGNDHITLAININAGASGTHTWNERQVLEKMLEKNPAMEQFIKEFKLNLG